MRFLFKMAFWLALIAFFLPSPHSRDSEAASVNYLSAFMGAQQALGDVGGFCERAPMACAAGQDVGAYVALRVKDGVAYAYQALDPAAATPPATVPAVALFQTPVQANTPDPMATAAVGADHVRRMAGLPPYASPVPASPASKVQPVRDRAAVAVPTPAPRT